VDVYTWEIADPRAEEEFEAVLDRLAAEQDRRRLIEYTTDEQV